VPSLTGLIGRFSLEDEEDIRQVDDYMSPWMAAVAGICLAAEVRLDSLGLELADAVFEQWDPRLTWEQDEMSTWCGAGAEAENTFSWEMVVMSFDGRPSQQASWGGAGLGVERLRQDDYRNASYAAVGDNDDLRADCTDLWSCTKCRIACPRNSCLHVFPHPLPMTVQFCGSEPCSSNAWRREYGRLLATHTLFSLEAQSQRMQPVAGTAHDLLCPGRVQPVASTATTTTFASVAQGSRLCLDDFCPGRCFKAGSLSNLGTVLSSQDSTAEVDSRGQPCCNKDGPGSNPVADLTTDGGPLHSGRRSQDNDKLARQPCCIKGGSLSDPVADLATARGPLHRCHRSQGSDRIGTGPLDHLASPDDSLVAPSLGEQNPRTAFQAPLYLPL